jgi:uncharacterized protein YbjT (DUF2867 family)
MATIFITGGSGYMGRSLIGELQRRQHRVRALVRAGSAAKLPPGCEPVLGDALDASTYRDEVRGADTFVHLVGVAHPSPAKAEQFRKVDLVSIEAAVDAAAYAGVRHFIYVSVAHPAPMMRAYIAVRSGGEEMIRQAGLAATILRPWYVLGPGHRWPHLLRPVYWLMEQIPPTREGARRLGLVTLPQMVDALVRAVEQPSREVRIVEVPQIRQGLTYLDPCSLT